MIKGGREMGLVRKLDGEKEFIDLANIISYAYPGFGMETEEQKLKFIKGAMETQEHNNFVKFYGIFDKDKLLGVMRYHDYYMNLLSKEVKVGGIGLIGVHHLHKKEKIAKSIMVDFIDHYRHKGVSLVILYPFNSGFYKKMGFGFGTSMYQYKIKPIDLPKINSKRNIHLLSNRHVGEILDSYTRIYNKTNGLIKKYEKDFEIIFNNPKYTVAAYMDNSEIKGYIIYEFKQSDDNFLINDIIINQLVFENQNALMELMTFLNSQSDQIRYIYFNLQDDGFRYILDNPTDYSDKLLAPVYHQYSLQGTGLMYRVIDTKRVFEELKNHNFNNQTCRLKISLKDTLISENNSSIIIELENGLATIIKDGIYDVEIAMDISDFSSLISCAVEFKTLLKYGRASISNEKYVAKVNAIFSSADKPICLTTF